MSYPAALRPYLPRRRPLHGIRRAILGVIGGYDAGEQIRPFYAEAGRVLPVLPEEIVIDPDGTYEAMFDGLTDPTVPPGVGKFSVMDEYVLPAGTGHHESSHCWRSVMVSKLCMLYAWTYATALDYLQTKFWSACGFPGSWQDAQYESDHASSVNQAWMMSPNEMIAERGRLVIGPPGDEYGEKTMNWGVAFDLVRMREFFDAMMTEVGEDIMKVYEFSLPLVNGDASRVGSNAIALLESERVTLGLTSGRSYKVICERTWLAGVETTLPDTRAWLVEDTAVPLGATGRWKLNAMVRRDYGGSGRYEAAIAPVTAKVVK